MRRWLTLLTIAFVPLFGVAAEIELSAPVRVIGSVPEPQPQTMQMRPPRTEPAVTRALLPQYQDASAFRTDVSQEPDREKAALRFIVALPHRPLLLEAFVTIDGQPFEMIREQRIDRLIDALMQPESVEPETASAAESPNGAATNESDGSTETPTEEPISQNEAADPATEEEPEEALISEPSQTLDARLRRYAMVTGRPPTRDELRWLLTKWVDGPTLLLLDDHFQRFRSTQAPAFRVLDRDMDGTISVKEIAAAYESLMACDVNQNDVVDYTEIAAVADDPRHKVFATPAHGLIPILDAPAVASAFRRLARRYDSPNTLRRFDRDADGELSVDEIAKLSELDPDVSLSVSFDTKDATKSSVTVTPISTDVSVVNDLSASTGPWVKISLGGMLLEFSAVQSAQLSDSDQISVGVVNDGYPVLPTIDPNEDGRLTIREMRDVLTHLERLDVDRNGAISQEEVPSTVRVSFGLGPTVHQHLADIRLVRPPSTEPQVAAPNWFRQMDANKDGDISPREFLLGSGKFKELDADNDGLVSLQEAITLTGNNLKATSTSNSEQEQTTP